MANRQSGRSNRGGGRSGQRENVRREAPLPDDFVRARDVVNPAASRRSEREDPALLITPDTASEVWDPLMTEHPIGDDVLHPGGSESDINMALSEEGYPGQYVGAEKKRKQRRPNAAGVSRGKTSARKSSASTRSAASGKRATGSARAAAATRATGSKRAASARGKGAAATAGRKRTTAATRKTKKR